MTAPEVPPNRVIREGDVPPRRPPPPSPGSRDPGVDVTAAPRYRIVTDGLTFKAQRRWWFLWRDIASTWPLTTREEASVVMNKQIARDTRLRGGWRIVETKR